MKPFRVIQISDTHLSADLPSFVQNFEAMTRIVMARRPDLVVNSGDIALDGTNREDDLAFARRCHDALDVPWIGIPGNHDVGDNPWQAGSTDAVTDERVSRYRRHLGADWWVVDARGWVLIGLNAQVFGSRLSAEDEQWTFLASAVATAGARPIALFVHKPLFKDHAGEEEVSGRYVVPESRRQLRDALGEANVKLVGSGHLHQHRQHRPDGVDHCWAPSTAFVLPDRRQPHIGVKRVGYVAYTFREDDVEVEIVEAPELVNYDRDQFPDLYR